MSNSEVSWTCRTHPTGWFHEVGCPHQKWTAEDLHKALVLAKKVERDRVSREIATARLVEAVKALTERASPCYSHNGGFVYCYYCDEPVSGSHRPSCLWFQLEEALKKVKEVAV